MIQISYTSMALAGIALHTHRLSPRPCSSCLPRATPFASSSSPRAASATASLQLYPRRHAAPPLARRSERRPLRSKGPTRSCKRLLTLIVTTAAAVPKKLREHASSRGHACERGDVDDSGCAALAALRGFKHARFEPGSSLPSVARSEVSVAASRSLPARSAVRPRE